ncbi:Rne/Rng family ribonuclease [Hasllibacter halocynthiae]|uniref:Rne/Rng family ribonuclease n=1 Tax=Hasllibacter halocynthiae TaxID=595589 RepID=A0A2T0X6T1_9RHOB|nr:ribonuclease E/G [Hasllibacter halocynthiae]PRY94633.1 Rne/Rng family ribonuclease [Hasllibacter halocynthiae]
MKGRVAALGIVEGRQVAGLVVDGRVEDLLVEGPGLAPGAVLRGVVDRPLKGTGGVIVRLPGGTGFLRGARGRRPGEAILVQVVGWPEGGKAVPLTDRVVLKSRYAIATPGAPGINVSRAIRDEDMRDELTVLTREVLVDAPLPDGVGLILRSACEGADMDAVAADVAAAAGLAAQVLGDAGGGPELLVDGPDPHVAAWRDWDARPDDAPDALARHGVLDALDALSRPDMPLPGGGTLAVEATRALVAVDVDTGSDRSPAAGLKAGIAAMRELPRQLRLRGLGGMVVVDLAPVPKKDRRQIEAALKAALRADPVETSVAGWTPLGNLEMTRKRERLPLSVALSRR